MNVLILILIIGAAVLAMYGVWKERAQTAIGLAVLAISIALLLERVIP